jgi:hypothetical protein
MALEYPTLKVKWNIRIILSYLSTWATNAAVIEVVEKGLSSKKVA